jgi:hypothetical protein
MAELNISNQVGAREDLSDLIAVADQKSTPLLSQARKSKDATNALFSWQVDAVSDPVLTGVLSNADATTFANPAANRARLYGRIQKLWRLPKVDDMAENVSDVAGIGRKREMARAVTRGMQELARDLESTFCSDQDSVAQDSTPTAFKTRGLGSWIRNSAQADTATAVPAAFLTPANSIITTATNSITDSSILGILQSVYEQVGKSKDYTLLCGPTLKRRFAAFQQTQFGSANTASTIRLFNQDSSDASYMAKVDVFIGDFGEISLVPSLFLAKDQNSATQLRRGYLLDMDMVSIRYNRRPRYMPLPDLGGGPRGIIDTIAALQVDNPLAFGKIGSTAD